MRYILIAITFMLFAPLAHAHVPLPPEIILEWQNAAVTCQSRGQTFSYDMRYLVTQDVTTDSLPDYIISTAGYMCDNDHAAFNDPLGHTYHIFRAGADGRYTRYTPQFRAYELTIEPRSDRRFLNFRVACDPSLKSDRRGVTRLEWEYDEATFAIHHREIGCSTKKRNRDRDDDGGWFGIDFDFPDFDVDSGNNEPFRLQD